jgi:hypothetical protein
MKVDQGWVSHGPSFRAWTLRVSFAAVVVAFTMGSSSIPQVKHAGLSVRWVVLLAVLLVVAAGAWERWSRTRRRPTEGLLSFVVLAAAFVGLAVVSTGWSVAPRLTFERSVSIGILFTVGALLAYVLEGDDSARRSALGGLAGGGVVVALLGAAMLVVDRTHAVQHTTAITPWRFRGFTENPNTISVLAAVVLPIIGWLVLTAKETRVRVAWVIGGSLLLISVIGAESRGGLLACAVGLGVVCIALVRPWQRLVVALVTLTVILVGGIELRSATDPGQAAFVSIMPAPPAVPPGYFTGNGNGHSGSGNGSGGSGNGSGNEQGAGKAVRRKPVHLTARTIELPSEDSEIGHPLLSRSASSVAGSGRVAEWKGVLGDVRRRPLLGYGFGTEETVFRDRWYYFQGGTAENSYLGILLQLGGLGALLLVGLGVVLGVASVRMLRRTPLPRRGEVAAGLGVLVAAAALMLIQSYIYSVGNVASGVVWITLFLLGSIVLGKADDAASA